MNLNISYAELLKPLCWICKKEVEQFDVYDDFPRYAKIFVAKCHGFEQRFWLGNEFVNDLLNNNSLEKGYAFKPEDVNLLNDNRGVDSDTHNGRNDVYLTHWPRGEYNR
jgi:hypothetical protein